MVIELPYLQMFDFCLKSRILLSPPATVSRAGMIYMDLEELGWEPYVACWIKQKPGEEFREQLQELVDKYVPKVLKVKWT